MRRYSGFARPSLHSGPVGFGPVRFGRLGLGLLNKAPKVVAGVAAAVAFSVASGAEAKQEYYDALADTGTCLDCRLCHNTAIGSAASIAYEKPFVMGILKDGTKGKLPLAETDSDEDGVTDLVELQEFGDPNDPMVKQDQVECPDEIKYGCVSIAPLNKKVSRGEHPDWAAWGSAALAALFASVVVRRRYRA